VPVKSLEREKIMKQLLKKAMFTSILLAAVLGLASESHACSYPGLQGCVIPTDVSRCLTPTNDNQCVANKQGSYPLYDRNTNTLVEGCYTDKFVRFANLPANRSCAAVANAPIRVEIYYQTICSDGRPKCLSGSDVNVFPIIKADTTVSSIKMILPEQTNQPVSLKNTSQSNASKSFCSTLAGNGYVYNAVTKQCDISVETQCSLLGMEYDVTNNKCISDLCTASVCTLAVTDKVCKGYTINPAGLSCACKGTATTSDQNGASCAENLTVSSIFLSDTTSCAIMSDKTVKCWGYNALGQIGDGTLVTRSTPVKVTGISNAVQGSGGRDGNCIVNTGGQIQCWGNGPNFNTGTGAPYTLPGVTDAVEVAVTKYSACYRNTSNRVYCWGRGNDGQLGNGAWVSSATPVQVVDDGWTPITATKISISDTSNGTDYETHACARITDGRVLCWGHDGNGAIGYGDGGYNSKERAQEFSSAGSGTSDFSTGRDSTCVVRGDGRINCSGNLNTIHDRYEYPQWISGMDSLAKVAAGDSFFCGITLAGEIKCRGRNDFGQMGRGVVGGQATPGWGVTYSGTSFQSNGEPIPSLYSVSEIQAGAHHACALSADKTVRCWGRNSGTAAGAVGDGTTTNRGSPTLVGI
jgi:alpha-tubulin suppressor-like RCC1 family protein